MLLLVEGSLSFFKLISTQSFKEMHQPDSYQSQPNNFQSESSARQSRGGLGASGYSQNQSGISNFPGSSNHPVNSNNNNTPSQQGVSSHTNGGLVYATGTLEQQHNYHNDGSYKENLQQQQYPKRYPSAAPPSNLTAGASLGRSNTTGGGSFQNHHQSDNNHAENHNQSSGNGRRRVPSVESFRSAVATSPYMGSQSGVSVGPNRATHYAASEYNPSTMPRERGYIRSNDVYNRSTVDFGRPNESYNSRLNDFSSSYRNPPASSYESAGQKVNNSYDRPQSRAPGTGYRLTSAYPSSYPNSAPYAQTNTAYTSGHPNSSNNNIHNYNGQQMNNNSRMDNRRPDSRIAFNDSNRIYADQNAYNQRENQPQYQSESHNTPYSGYRPPSAARTDYDGYNSYSQQQSQIMPQQQPKVYKSRSTISLKGGVSSNSPLFQNTTSFTRKGSMEEKQPLPEAFRTQSKKMEKLLVHARNTPAATLKGFSIPFFYIVVDVNNMEMLNLQGLEVTDPLSPPPQTHFPHPKSLKDLYSLSREIASLVLNRPTPLSRDEWSLLVQKVNHQVSIVDEIDK